jgi:hypothetical protein
VAFVDGSTDYALSLSGDGTVVAVGVKGYNNNNGYVRVYASTGGVWSRRGSDIVDTNSGDYLTDSFGADVALSSDGNTVVVGAPGFRNGNGFVHAFKYTTVNGWTSKSTLISGYAGDSSDRYFGISVSLSSDGSIFAFGGPGFTSSLITRRGTVRVYSISGSTNTLLGAVLVGTNAYDEFGSDVSLSGNGAVLAVGASRAASYTGYVRVYSYASSSWTQRGSDITGSAAGDSFGLKVSLSTDGDTVAIGAPGHDNNKGMVRVYEWISGSWTQKGSDIVGSQPGESLGKCLSMKVSTVMSVCVDSMSGTQSQHRIYDFDGSDYVLRVVDIVKTGGTPYDVSMNGDGTTMAIVDPSLNAVELYEIFI